MLKFVIVAAFLVASSYASSYGYEYPIKHEVAYPKPYKHDSYAYPIKHESVYPKPYKHESYAYPIKHEVAYQRPLTYLDLVNPACIGIDYTAVAGNCRQFYRCSNAGLLIESCPANLVWSNKLRTCIWGTCANENVYLKTNVKVPVYRPQQVIRPMAYQAPAVY